jgi:hypothetical protein
MTGVGNEGRPAEPSPGQLLPVVLRDVDEFLAPGGWDQPPKLFAIVPTRDLLAAEPRLAGQIDVAAGLTPVAQEPLAGQDVPGALAGIYWPETVVGCALAQEIVVLPPGAEADLSAAVGEVAPGSSDEQVAELTVRAAQRHPDRREARLVVAVLRDGDHRCMLRMRGAADDPDGDDELIERPDLAPNMVEALLRTLRG